MIPETQYNTEVTMPKWSLDAIWKRKIFIFRMGIYCALIGFVAFLFVPWKIHYQAMIRIEPELSTTGETTSLETEMDVIQSWSNIINTVQQLHRMVIVKPARPPFFMHLNYFGNCLKNIALGKPIVDFITYQPSLSIDYFTLQTVGNSNTNSSGESFILKVDNDDHYQLYDKDTNQKILEGKAGDFVVIKFFNKQHIQKKLELFVGILNAQKGDSFFITTTTPEGLAASLIGGLKVERRGFRERSGLLEASYSGTDPNLGLQFLVTLANSYISGAYDRSSLGKIQGLNKLEAQSHILSQQAADAEKILKEYKDNNNIIDIPKEKESSFHRYIEAQELLTTLKMKYDEASVALTDNHPSMIALRKQISSLKNELKQLRQHMDDLSAKDLKLLQLSNNVTTAYTMLKQNTALHAELHAQVQTITGYAHLVSLYQDGASAPVTLCLLSLFFGFMTGSMGALAWLLKILSPVFALIRYPEDLNIIAPLPVAAKLPFKAMTFPWLMYWNFDNSTVSTQQKWTRDATNEIKRLENDLAYILPSSTNKILLFTSIDNNKGVAFCARQLAIASARTCKTIIIDANIMDPSVHSEFGCENISGLSSILAGQLDVIEAVQKTTIPNLHIISGGKQTSNFRLLYNVKEINNVLNELSVHFDRIIIEATAINMSICSTGILNIMHALFIVVGRDTLARKLAKTLAECQVNSHPAAFFILNKG